MNMYRVTYDVLIGGRYHEAKPVLLAANNKKEACQAIKDRYYEKLNKYIDMGYATSTAKKFVRWPFHIKAWRC